VQRHFVAGFRVVGPPSSWSKTRGSTCRTPSANCSRVVSSELFTILPTLASAQANDATAGHADPVTPVVLALAVLLTAAKFGGHLAVRMGQPAVLGEVVAGVALGSLDLTGIGWCHGIEADATVEILARLGVVILLFEVGLESTVSDMLKVGLPSVLVAVLAWSRPSRSGGRGRMDASG
jgi:Na+:H+ antiporter